MLKGDNNYPMSVTTAYDMLTSFEFVAKRQHCTRCKVDRGNMNNHGGHGSWYHMFVQHTVPSGTVFPPGLDERTSYCIIFYSIVKSGDIMKKQSQKQQKELL